MKHNSNIKKMIEKRKKRKDNLSSFIPPLSFSQTRVTGFTLIEVMIVTTILGGILMGTIYVIMNAQDIFNQGAMQSHLESEGARLIDLIQEDINECQVAIASMPNASNNFTTLTIKVPVKVGGNYWNPATGVIYWGAEGNQNWYITYSFVLANTLNEATTKLDYNGDRDITDSFDIGNLWKYVYNASGTLQQQVNLGGNIITVATNRYFNINTGINDGGNDPIFSIRDKYNNLVTSGSSGNRVRINLWFSGLGAKRLPIIVNCKTDVVLFNPQ